MKHNCTFEFADEPQFRTVASRAEFANRLWAYRKARGNLGCRIYTIRRATIGVYSVTINTTSAPTAILNCRA